MAIACGEPIAVVDFDHLAVSALKISVGHNTTGGRDDWMPVAASNVYTAVECAFTVEWIDALTEAAGHLAFDGPEIRGRVGANPVGGGRVPRQAHGEADHRRSGKS